MKECDACQERTVRKLLDKFSIAHDLQVDVIAETKAIIKANQGKPNPFVAAEIHRSLKKQLGIEDLYKEEKHHSNTALLENLPTWEAMIKNAPSQFEKAAQLAVIGNIIDYGAHSVKDDIIAQINELEKKSFRIDHRAQLLHKIKTAKSIVYLGDNSGEIVFDKLFIQTFNHNNITYVVRGGAVLNDVTTEDAELIGMHEVAKVISNGFDAPSTLLENGSEEFLSAYNNADLIISKGQGNFEGLVYQKDPRLFFMLMAKCRIMADMIHVGLGDLIIMQQNIMNNFK